MADWETEAIRRIPVLSKKNWEVYFIGEVQILLSVGRTEPGSDCTEDSNQNTKNQGGHVTLFPVGYCQLVTATPSEDARVNSNQK